MPSPGLDLRSTQPSAMLRSIGPPRPRSDRSEHFHRGLDDFVELQQRILGGRTPAVFFELGFLVNHTRRRDACFRFARTESALASMLAGASVVHYVYQPAPDHPRLRTTRGDCQAVRSFVRFVVRSSFPKHEAAAKGEARAPRGPSRTARPSVGPLGRFPNAERDDGDDSATPSRCRDSPGVVHPPRLLSLFCLMSLLVYVDRGVISSAAVSGSPRVGAGDPGSGLQGEFGVGYALFGLLQAAFMLGLLIGAPAFSAAAKTWNPFKLIGLGLAGWTLAAAGARRRRRTRRSSPAASSSASARRPSVRSRRRSSTTSRLPGARRSGWRRSTSASRSE